MDIPSIYITKTPQETKKLGEEVARELVHGSWFVVRSKKVVVVCLYGELGSGKTVFASGFACGLGLDQRILSPTFLLMRTYSMPGGGNFYHLDLYRTTGIEEIKDLGFKEIVDNEDNVILVEWAEKLGKLLPEKRVEVYFRVLDKGVHEIMILS